MNDPYMKLREQLELQEWPNVYLFKFIIPNNPELLAKTTALFDDGADVHYQPSKKGNYMSVSAKEMMISVDSIIDRYERAAKIKGLLAL